jgi:tripartite-type tricarboxylate transporter receptor subunit TctC
MPAPISPFGFFAPGKTPDEIVKHLNGEINKAIALPDIQERLIRLENIPSSSSLEQFAKLIRSEYEAIAKVVKAANGGLNLVHPRHRPAGQ